MRRFFRFARVWPLICTEVLVIGLGIAQPQTTTPADVSAVGGVSAREIELGDGLDFWFTIQNKTTSDLSTVRLVRVPQNYEIESICAQDSQHNGSCRNKSEFEKDNNLINASILSGQSITVWGVLKPQKTHKSQTLSLVIQWYIASEKNIPHANSGQNLSQRSSMTVVLGDNAVPSWWDANSAWVYGPLGVAIVGAILGLIANIVLKRREERQEAAAKGLQEERAKGEKAERDLKDQQQKERDARGETLRLLLPVSHKYATLYYLPLSRAAERASKAFHKVAQELHTSPRNPALFHAAARGAFFYLLLVRRITDEIRNRIGGFYFKDLRGEELAAQCIRKFEKLLGEEEAVFPLAVQRLANSLDRTTTYEEFIRQFWTVPSYTVPDPANRDAWRLFEQWLIHSKNRKEGIEYLASLTVVLDYESNRPYTYWYDVRGKLQLSFQLTGQDSIFVGPTLLKLADDSNFTKIQIQDYFASED